MVLRAPAVVVLHRLSRPLLSLPSWSLWRRPLLGLLPLLAGFHSGSANERPAGERRAGAESGPVVLAVASLLWCRFPGSVSPEQPALLTPGCHLAPPLG